MSDSASFFPFEIEPSWHAILSEEFTKPYMAQLAAFVAKERTGNIPVYPPHELMFNAFLKTPYEQVKVLIMGQDPYHGPGQAHGLSFSVPKGIPAPPSLKNIFKEIQEDLNIPSPSHGCLTRWAEQGVMLLNATLTVRQSQPMSHHNQGWELFTDAAVKALALREEPVIFVLWGKSAQEKGRQLAVLDKAKKHPILTAPHPSPFSAHSGFFGCHHFSKINELLQARGAPTINWDLR